MSAPSSPQLTLKIGLLEPADGLERRWQSSLCLFGASLAIKESATSDGSVLSRAPSTASLFAETTSPLLGQCKFTRLISCAISGKKDNQAVARESALVVKDVRKVTPRISAPLSEILHASKNRLTSLNSIPWSNCDLNDEDLKIGVYVKTLQALIYPISKSTPHNFRLFTATKPTFCYECEGLLWGLARQGLKCPECGVKCHEKCQSLLNADCLQRAAERSARGSQLAAMLTTELSERMRKRERDSAELFELVRRTFEVDEVEHTDFMVSIRQAVVDGVSQWAAKIHVTVVCAQGLMSMDSNGLSDPYVTVQVGKTKKRTRTIPQDLSPHWNQSFTFDCQNSSERIKVRVWDEDDDIRSKLKHKLTREQDDFLGQTTIDARTLSGQMSDVWYTLEKRSEGKDVSGAIQLRISIEIKGEEKSWPFHMQYTYLHESLFNYLCEENEGLFVLPHVKGDDAWKTCFDYPAEEVIKEFAIRYGIEPIFVAMTHFSCLANKYLSDGVPGILSTLLAQINAHYSQKAAASNVSACYMFNATNFGKENFISLLDRLYNIIRLDLSMYRCMFPADRPEKLRDLKSTIDLMTSILFFRLKVQELPDPPRSVSVVKECVQTCLRETYRMLYDNCSVLHTKLNPGTTGTSSSSLTMVGGPNLEGAAAKSLLVGELGMNEKNKSLPNPLEFWHQLIDLIRFAIEEDRACYQAVLNHFVQDVNIGDLSALRLWELFANDLKSALEAHESRHQVQDSSAFINLHFKVKWFHEWLCKDLPALRDALPEYVTWFEPLVMKWLHEKEEASRAFVQGAWEKDKHEKFEAVSENAFFSFSVVDTFSCLIQTYEVLKRLECPILEVKNKYTRRYTKMVILLLNCYCELVKSDVFECASRPATIHTACTLMNNLQELRHQLEELYIRMGGPEMDTDSGALLQEMQRSLNQKLESSSCLFADGYLSEAKASVNELSGQLAQIKGPGSVTNQAALRKQTDVIDDASLILVPIMPLLEGHMGAYSGHCDESVRKRLLKRLWATLVRLIEEVCLLPPLQHEKKRGSSNCSSDFGLKEVGRMFSLKNEKLAVQQSLSTRHCAVLDAALDTLKMSFSPGNGLKESYLEASPEFRSLKFALSLYSQSTDSLIKSFVQSQGNQDSLTRDETFGKINFQADLYTHPWTGERKVTVRVISCEDLAWPVIGSKPFVEIILIGPHLAGKKRRQSTKSKSNQQSPIFNETFTFNLGNEEDLSSYELHVSVKEYCFAKEDKLVGVTLLQLRALSEEGSIACRFPLARHMNIDTTGWTMLRVLAQRPADELAKEFVKLKTQTRDESM